MSRSAKVYIKGIYAGLLTEIDREHYSFCYDTDYYNNPQLPAVSLTMPKTQQEYTSSYLFPVFFNMTSEGDNRIIQARNLHIDEEDDFGILLATAHTDTIGAMATAICGAFVGYSKIKPEYTELLRVQNPETDFEEYINILEKGRELLGCERL